MLSKIYFLTLENSVFKYITKDDEIYETLLGSISEVEDDQSSETTDSFPTVDVNDKTDSPLDLFITTDSSGAVVDNEFTIHIDPRIRAKWLFDTDQKGKLRSPRMSRRTFCVDQVESKIQPHNAINSLKMVMTCKNSQSDKFPTSVFDIHLLNIADPAVPLTTKVILDPVIRNTT